jgi:hypothetical protein
MVIINSSLISRVDKAVFRGIFQEEAASAGEAVFTFQSPLYSLIYSLYQFRKGVNEES